MASFLPPRSPRQNPLLDALRRRPAAPHTASDDEPEAGALLAAGEPRRSSVVAAVLYQDDGTRAESFTDLAEVFSALRARPGGMAWIGLERPDEVELATLAEEFDLHPLAIEDAIQAHQRPKIERYDNTLFVVTHTARYLDDAEEVEFGELHVFVGPDFVVTLRHSASPDLSAVRTRLESDRAMLALGPEAVLYAILDEVVDGYAPVVAGLDNDIDEIESEVFVGDPEVSRRIYELSREVVDFQRAVRPLEKVCASLAKGAEKYGVDPSCGPTCATSPTTSSRPATASSPTGPRCATSSPSTRPSWRSGRTTR